VPSRRRQNWQMPARSELPHRQRRGISGPAGRTSRRVHRVHAAQGFKRRSPKAERAPRSCRDNFGRQPVCVRAGPGPRPGAHLSLRPRQGSLDANNPPFASVKPGSGPRHFAFHPKGRFGYVLNEMGSSVSAFAYDASRGGLTEVQTISTLPKDFAGEDNSAEIQTDAAVNSCMLPTWPRQHRRVRHR
jgi:hypothetical protein